ncbi:MAG: serine/threonine-protein kinase, partial [Myxococcota bacterium]
MSDPKQPEFAPTTLHPSEHLDNHPTELEPQVKVKPYVRQRTGDTLNHGIIAGSYVIEQLAFEGGFASIYRARHADTGAVAALKLLHRTLTTSPRMLERFRQEAEALNRLHHPNIVKIYELGELAEFRPYIAMEWLDGRNLYEELRLRGPLSDREALEIMTELGAALQAAHDLGIIHRDLK